MNTQHYINDLSSISTQRPTISGKDLREILEEHSTNIRLRKAINMFYKTDTTRGRLFKDSIGYKHIDITSDEVFDFNGLYATEHVYILDELSSSPSAYDIIDILTTNTILQEKIDIATMVLHSVNDRNKLLVRIEFDNTEKDDIALIQKQLVLVTLVGVELKSYHGKHSNKTNELINELVL